MHAPALLRASSDEGRGGPVPGARYGEVWRDARRLALTPAEFASPLATCIVGPDEPARLRIATALRLDNSTDPS
ncbi:hypothetical protein [Frankia sp. Cas3]|uniref:hypothetical protein n=1 Tax=Frankia sp. Cas3 TaxID=3073926 RepID=UPI002AD595BB|nr:hypothetical protein [Frankia sp. Cas3]